MSVGYSSIELLGYLGNDPQPLHSATGVQGARFSVAVNRVWAEETGKQGDTDWFTVVAWGQVAENCLTYLSKGSLVFVAGKPRIQRWKDKKGGSREQIQVLTDKVIFLERAEPEENN